MYNIKMGVWRICGFVCFVTLTGCVNLTKVADVTSDKMGYSDRNFSAQSVNSEVTKVISGKINPPENFRELEISFSSETELTNGQKSSSNGLMISRPAGNGLVQQLIEYSANDIPINLFYVLRYGVVNLRSQVVPLQGAVVLPMLEVKKIARFDSIPTREGEEFIFDLAMGGAQMQTALSSIVLTCKISKIGSAKATSSQMTGRAMNIGCTSKNGDSGAISGRTEWLFFEDYGVPVMLESVNVSSKSVYKIKEVKFRRAE